MIAFYRYVTIKRILQGNKVFFLKTLRCWNIRFFSSPVFHKFSNESNGLLFNKLERYQKYHVKFVSNFRAVIFVSFQLLKEDQLRFSVTNYLTKGRFPKFLAL